jgi:cytochrome b6-f complex iron-sulfur subunit/menaquinol-cytochrome c reductase iron-sulfur subunit
MGALYRTAEPDGQGSRRGFLALVAAVGSAVAAAIAGVPLAAALLSPIRRKTEEADFVRVARLDTLPEGKPVRATVVAARMDAWSRQPASPLGAVWLVRRGDAVSAFSATCPHLGCSVDARADGFACPCHGSAFALDGQVRRGPAPRGLDPIDVRITPGDPPTVLVRFRRFAIGTAERREA